MASIRLFGRGKAGSAAKAAAPRAGGGAAVDADLIAAALADLSTAALSATWRCRHSAGLSIGEGAVDFGAHRSRATVIRGKATYEYVRDGASVYRSLVPEEGDGAADPEGALEDEAGEGEEELAAALEEDELDGVDLEGDQDEDGEGDEGADAEPQLEADGESEGGDGDDDAERLEASEDEDGAGEDAHGDGDTDADEDPQELEGSDGGDGVDGFGDEADKGRDARAWQTFSEHDACGPHAYAEPAVLAQAVRRAGVVQTRKAEDFDGVMLAAFSVTAKPKPADPDKLLARLARQLRDHGANTVVVTAFVDESAPVPAAAPETDGDNETDTDAVEPSGTGSATGTGAPRIVRLRVELPHWTPADDPTADHTVSVDLFELGDPVQIEVPDRDSVTRRTSRTCADLGLF